MKRAHGGALLLSWGMCSAAFGTNGCGLEPHSCTLIGCTNGETFAFPMPKQTASAVRVEACRNGECWQAQMASDPNGQGQFLTFEQDGYWYATLQLRVDPSSWYVTVEFPVKNYSEVVVGDFLKVTFTDAEGKPLYAVSGTTDAPKDSYPNGPDCDPSPCRQATAEISQL